MDKEVKQVIVIRRDLNMRRGKECSQASHSSMAFILERLLRPVGQTGLPKLLPMTEEDLPKGYQALGLTEAQIQWLTNERMTKVCLQAANLEELQEVEKLARAAGLTTHVITDAGLTEFKEPTITAMAIGPDYAEEIDKVTGRDGKHPLKLY